MDQKNTIVKCTKHKCLFNNCGTCDQYIITIGVDNTCQAYTETEGFTFTEQKTCHPDCIHFDDNDPMVGPICLFNHPEPLKKFYEGMPCDYYYSTNYTRGQRAKCDFIQDGVDQEIVNEVCKPFDIKPSATATLKSNVYDDICDISFLKEDLEKIQQTLEQDSIPCTMKVAELNKPNKNQFVINDWTYAATPDICKTCKKVVYGQPCKWKDVAYGVWTCYEEAIDEV